MADNFIEFSKYFSRTNEEEGKWFEPEVKGQKCGLKFKVNGPNSTAASVANDIFDKAREQIETIEDAKEKDEAFTKALVNKVLGIVSDIEPSGKPVVINGKMATKEDLLLILTQAPVITLQILKFSQQQNNFLD